MPVVPFAPQPPKGRALPKPIEFSAAEEPWVLMAAAQMHAEKRLIADSSQFPTFDVNKIKPFLNKEVPPGKYPKESRDNQENRVIEDLAVEGDEFDNEKRQALNKKYNLQHGDKVLLYNKRGNQFGYRRDDEYDGGFTFWSPHEEGSM